MHTSESYSSNVPAFLIKLWKLVEDTSCNDLISWSECGSSFIIRDQAKFAKELLPLYFKHNNMASFIRQLNMYGFRKVANYDRGGLKAESDEMEFHHMFFRKGESSLLELIKRKMPTTKGNSASENLARSPNPKELLNDLTSIRQKQENMDAMLLEMKKENAVLWKEISVLRNKHKTQEQIIQKVIHFLVSLVRSNQGLAPKRKLPCLLHDSKGPKGKTVKLSPKLGLLRGENSSLCISVLPENMESPQGPVIHEVTDFEIDDEETPVPTELNDNLLLSKDYPIITSTSPGEPEKLEPQQTGLSGDPSEILSAPEQEFSSVTAEVLPPSDEELSTITAEILPSADTDASQQPVLISLTDNGLRLESEGPISLTPEMLMSPECCFKIVGNSENLDAKVPEEPSATQILKKSDISGDVETEQIVDSEVIHNIEIAAEDIANYSSLFGGSVKDVLLCNSQAEDDETNNQENKSNNLQLAVSDPNASTSGTFAKNVFSNHVINIEEDLDWLQDQLRLGNLNIDSSTLLGVCQRWESSTSLDSQLFSSDEFINNAVLTSQFANESCDSAKETGNDITGNELVQFSSSAFETDLNSVETPVFEFLNDSVPLNCNESLLPETDEPVCEAEGGSHDGSDGDSIKVNFQALMDTGKTDYCMPSKSSTKKKKRNQRVK